jgi:probable HAF family extracellular repeat protein
MVGSTLDSGFNWSHAFIWQDGMMTDLNTLFPAGSNLLATMANKINESGQISGMATVLRGPHAGDTHAFLATPANESNAGQLQTSHVHARNLICTRILANSFCRDSYSADWSDKEYLRRFRTMHSSKCCAKPQAGRCAGQHGSRQDRRDPQLFRVMADRKSEWTRSLNTIKVFCHLWFRAEASQPTRPYPCTQIQ